MLLVSAARDASLWFLYESAVASFYFLGFSFCFFSLVDDEIPEAVSDTVFLPGGYPEVRFRFLFKPKKFCVWRKLAVA